MKKLSTILIIVLLSVVLVIGCGTPTTPTAPATPTTPTAPTTPATPTTPTTPATPTTPTTPAKPTTPTPTTPAKPAPAKPTGPVYGGTLRVVEAGAPGGAIGWPPEIAGGAGVTAQFSLQQLIEQSGKGDFLPNLAESFDVDSNPDSPSVTFHIRKGVTFHDGTKFDANVVKWNFDQIKGGVNPSTTAQWASWEVLDDYTIKVNLKSWRNINVRGFTGIGALIASPTAYELKGLEWMRWHMVGTGPFKQVEFSKDVRYRGVRNDDFWDTGKPYLQGIDVEYVADQLTRIALFKAGDADVMGVAPKDAYDFQQAGYTIINRLGGANALYPDSMNKDSIWANPKVRMAVEYAIDKEAMAKAFGYGFNPAAYQVPNPDMTAYLPSIEGRKYDPEKAKQLLAEAGYPSGFKGKIITRSEVNRDEVVAIQAYLGAVGIDIELDFYEPAKLFGLLLGTWNDALIYHQTRNFPDFNASMNLEFGVPFTTFFKSTKKPDGFKEALDASMATKFEDPALMQKCVQMLYDDCTVIPVTYYSSLWVTRNNIHDTGYGERGSTTESVLKNAWISK